MNTGSKEAPIRVLQVLGIMNRGGAESMLMNLYRHIDHTKVQFDFVVHSSNEGHFDKEIRSLGGEIFHCPSFRLQSMLKYKRWWNVFFELEGKKYTIVHGHIGSSASVYLSVAKKYGKTTIAHSHCRNDWGSMKSILYNIVSYPTRYISDLFFACSLNAGIDRYGHKIMENKRCSFTLNNAINLQTFLYSSDKYVEVRKSLGYSRSDILVGHVGRFNLQKNHTFLLDIFSKALEYNNNVRLILVGDGVLRKEIEAKIQSLGIVDKVNLVGVREDVNSLMIGMDMLLFPSLYEGLPVTLVEAQAAGLPCLISDTVSDESTIVDELMYRKPLSDSADSWAKKLLSIVDNKSERNSSTETLRSKGYDIFETSKWLENFYIERSLK